MLEIEDKNTTIIYIMRDGRIKTNRGRARHGPSYWAALILSVNPQSEPRTTVLKDISGRYKPGDAVPTHVGPTFLGKSEPVSEEAK